MALEFWAKSRERFYRLVNLNMTTVYWWVGVMTCTVEVMTCTVGVMTCTVGVMTCTAGLADIAMQARSELRFSRGAEGTKSKTPNNFM